MLCLALAVCGYFLNLWWMDTLQTIKYAYLPIALFQVISRENGKYVGFATQSGAQIHKVNREKKRKRKPKRKRKCEKFGCLQ